MNEFDKLKPADINKLHEKDDTDVSQNSHHHTLGRGATEASPGNHTHDGRNSAELLDGFIISGNKGGNTAVASVIQALVRLGAQDATT